MVLIEDIVPLMETFSSFIPAPLMELIEDDDVREKVSETARIFFSNGNITVNLIPALLVGLGLLALKSLLGIPLLGLLGGGDTATGYGGGSSGYGAPDAGYGAPDAGYGAPDAGYGAPSGGGHAPSSGYDAGRKKRDAPLSDEQKALYDDVIVPNVIAGKVAPVADFVLNHAVDQAAVVSESLALLD